MKVFIIIICLMNEKTKTNSQSVRGSTQYPPKKEGSQDKKSKVEVVPPIAPITAAAFPCCTAMDRHRSATRKCNSSTRYGNMLFTPTSLPSS